MEPRVNLIVALVVASSSLGAIMLFSLCYWIYHVRCKRQDYTDTSSPESLEAQKGLSVTPFFSKFSSLKVVKKKPSASFIDYNLLEKATNNFESTNKLGEGGFGCVYKGTLDDNTQVAVKKLDPGSQGISREFQTEVHLLSTMQHPNIISLVGYCTEGQTKCIVYELMQNGSLETQLYGPSEGSLLTWHMRMKIALDTARGLEYLHDKCKPRVIHRDLKTANILLDSSFNAKLSDFGLAVIEGSRKKDKSDLSGTLGYVAPEYLLDGKLTEKSDVYAFGVVLLELLLGRRPLEKLAPGQCQSIVSWAMPQLTDRAKLPNIIDPAIKDTMDTKHLYQVAAVALLCVQSEPSYRPLITDVLHSLVPLVPLELGGTFKAT